jgi:hypothetical protein
MVAYLDDEDLPSFYNGTSWTTEFGGGGLVAVKHATLTDVFSATISAGTATNITSLSISHALSDAANTLHLFAFIGQVAASNAVRGVGIQIAAGGTAIGIGDTAGSRVSTGAFGFDATGTGGRVAGPVAHHVQYAPASTASVTYTVQAVDVGSGTLYINRSNTDSNSTDFARTASTFVLVEVKV